uniref:Uncharacterized protein n=1 Tax=Avena sativa TaxID=4498 RepID=A0ACD5V9F4_AVESA
MLRLRACIASHLLPSPSTSAISTLHRLISAAAPAISPRPGFAVEDYLIDTCGLTRAQALRASRKLTHLKSRAKPDAVLSFLDSLGLSSTAVAATVARDPQFLCAKVDKTLDPVFVGLTDLGLSGPEIARLVPIAPDRFRCRSIVSTLQCYLVLFGSIEKLLWMVERRPYLLSGADLDNVVKPNLVFLRKCGLDIAKLCSHVPMILTTKPERIQEMVARAEGIGVPRDSGMFRQALQAVAFLTEERIAAQVDYLKKTFMWTDAEVRIAITRAPVLLRISKDKLRYRFEFFTSEVGLEPLYIAYRPVMLNYSMEGRLRPRHYVLKFLKAN